MKVRNRCSLPAVTLASAAAITLMLGGCATSDMSKMSEMPKMHDMPNASNPTLQITRAQIRGDRAMLDMQIDNPSDMNVNVDAVQWTLQYGPLPAAQGAWQLSTSVASKGKYRFTREVRFTSPALDPTASNVELAGTLQITTEGDMGNMGLNGAGFVATAKAEH